MRQRTGCGRRSSASGSNPFEGEPTADPSLDLRKVGGVTDLLESPPSLTTGVPVFRVILRQAETDLALDSAVGKPAPLSLSICMPLVTRAELDRAPASDALALLPVFLFSPIGSFSFRPRVAGLALLPELIFPGRLSDSFKSL